jgi:hypothetical protein
VTAQGAPRLKLLGHPLHLDDRDRVGDRGEVAHHAFKAQPLAF